MISVTALSLARRYLGVKEIIGKGNHPLISWWLSLCAYGMEAPDEIAWCSAYVNGIAWELSLPRSKSAAARSWLKVGTPVVLEDALPGFDVVVLERGNDGVSGHVGFYVSHNDKVVRLVGGNQSNAVTEQDFERVKVLGVRRLL